jgi:hypothetical protein
VSFGGGVVAGSSRTSRENAPVSYESESTMSEYVPAG